MRYYIMKLIIRLFDTNDLAYMYMEKLCQTKNDKGDPVHKAEARYDRKDGRYGILNVEFFDNMPY